MAGSRIKGITIEIGGDTTGLQKALQGVNKNLTKTQSDLRDVNRLLKLDPKNMELVAQKQKLLSQAVKDTSDKLKTLKTAAEQANKALADGKITGSQYDALKREIISTEQALKKLEDQASKTNQMVGKLKEFGGKATALGQAFAPVSAAAGFGLGASIKLAMDFEAAMSKVKAITKSDDEQMKRLEETARYLGKTTQFSATEAAEGMSYLGMAGWKTEQIVKGLPGVLNLAKAGGIGLAKAADIVSDDLTAFGLGADEAGRMADVFAETITNANTDVHMMGETMKYAAPVAKAYGLSLEETAALTGLMGGASIKASQAGTSIRSALLRLAGPPKAAAKQLDKLGISLSETAKGQVEASQELDALGIKYDKSAAGGGKLAGILQQLRDKFKTMSQEEQLASAKAIFGTEASSAWLSVLGAGEGTFEKFVQQLRDSEGAAKRVADTMGNNATGSIKEFNSAVQELGISVGQTFLAPLTGLVKALTGVVNTLNALPAPVKGFIGVLMGLVAVISPVLITIGQMAIGFGVLLEKFPALARLAPKLVGAFGLIGKAFTAMLAMITAHPIIAAITAIIAIIIYLWNNCESFRNGIIEIWNSVVESFANAGELIKEALNSIGTLIDEAKNWGSDLCNGIAQGIESGINNVKSAVNNVANAIKSRLHFSVPDEGPLTDYESWMPDFMKGLAKGIKANTGVVAKAINGVADTLSINPTIAAGSLNSGNDSVIKLNQPIMIDGKMLTSVVSQIQYSNGKASLRNLGRG